jgi:hypothetical protein
MCLVYIRTAVIKTVKNNVTLHYKTLFIKTVDNG